MKANADQPAWRPAHAPVWETIVEFGTSQNFVNGVTTLLAFTDYGSIYSDLAVILRNDATSPNAVSFIVDVSHGGVLPNTEMTQTKACPAGDERHVDLPRPNPDTYLRVEVSNAGATCTGTWALIGLRR
jgi:hypothetical protein